MSGDLWVVSALGLVTWLYLCYRTWHEKFEPEGLPDDWEADWEGVTTEKFFAEGNISENKT